MDITVKLNNLRIAPRKARLVADIIRNKKAEDARSVLNFTIKKASHPILKLLNSGLSSAKNNFQIDSNNLYISRITVDGGPMLKRWMPRARGRAAEIMKRTSHVTLVLSEINQTGAALSSKKGKKGAVAVTREKVEGLPGEIEAKEKKTRAFNKQKVEYGERRKSQNLSKGTKIFRRKSV